MCAGELSHALRATSHQTHTLVHLVRLGQDHADAPKPRTRTLAKGVRRRSHGSLPVFGRSEILLSLHLALLPPEALLLSTLDSSGIGGRGR